MVDALSACQGLAASQPAKSKLGDPLQTALHFPLEQAEAAFVERGCKKLKRGRWQACCKRMSVREDVLNRTVTLTVAILVASMVVGQYSADARADNKVISLLWANTTKVEDFGKKPRAVTSGFDKESSSPGKFEWKADQDSPLLVYDLKQQGIVNKETLFGIWTYGGRNYKDREAPREPWRDAFEALATLDGNRDSSVSGRELQLVSLWFDRNRDAQAQRDEVVPAAQAGLAEISLRGNPQSLSDDSRYYRQGYRRYTTKGELLTGPSISWVVASLDKKPTPTSTASPVPPAAVVPAIVPSTALPAADVARIESEAPAREGEKTPDADSGIANSNFTSLDEHPSRRFNGYWRWVQDFDAPPDTGAIQLEILENGEIRGSSVSSVPSKDNQDPVLVARFFVLQGRVNGETGEGISFKTLASDPKQESSSVATIVERGGKTFLKGSTTANVVDSDGIRREVTSEWLAVKSDAPH